jgi:hypothetical protein
MKLQDIIDPEEYRILKWAENNIPKRTYSPYEDVCRIITHDKRYIDLHEEEKEKFLLKAANEEMDIILGED